MPDTTVTEKPLPGLAKRLAAAAERALTADRQVFVPLHALDHRFREIADFLPAAIEAASGQMRIDLQAVEWLIFGDPPAYPVRA